MMILHLLFSLCTFFYRQWDCNEEDMVKRSVQIKTESIGDAISMQSPAFESTDNSMSTNFHFNLFFSFVLNCFIHWAMRFSCSQNHLKQKKVAIVLLCVFIFMYGAYWIMYLFYFFLILLLPQWLPLRTRFYFKFSFYNLLIVNRWNLIFFFWILNQIRGSTCFCAKAMNRWHPLKIQLIHLFFFN